MTVGDFYDAWLRCKLETENVDVNLATNLVKHMNSREKCLMSSEAILMGIYMDPRYHIVLSAEDKCTAEKHLRNLWTRLNHKDSANESSSSIANFEHTSDDENSDVVETYLREKAKKQGLYVNCTTVDSIDEVLKDYQNWPRLKKSRDIFEFWESKRTDYRVLYELAMTTLSLPMTQVSVERTFSHLRQVLSVLRYNLSSSMIDNIMLVRCNHYFGKE